jgi:hypothetical protein
VAGPTLKASGKLTAGADIGQAGTSLVNTSFTTALGIH